MRIFFLTLAYPVRDCRGNLYTDLMDELASRGHDIHVFAPDESGSMKRRLRRGSVRIELIRTGRVTKSAPISKALNTLLLGLRYMVRVRRAFMKVSPDLVVYSTPPITFLGAVRYLKWRSKCQTYLMLKDIFPQNAVDLGMMRKGGITWSYFRNKEKNLYRISDKIGCMSTANVAYVLEHNRSLEAKKIEVCHNSIYPSAKRTVGYSPESILAEYGIPTSALKLVYGGNLGRPQCVPFLIEAIDAFAGDPTVFFIVVGDGTDYRLMEHYKKRSGNTSLLLLPKLPGEKYSSLLSAMDAGLVFLDGRFTIPNYPSRILDYLDHSLPVIAATDTHTDIRDLLQKENCGLWSRTGDVNSFVNNVAVLKNNEILRREMGRMGRGILETRFSVGSSADAVLASVSMGFGEV